MTRARIVLFTLLIATGASVALLLHNLQKVSASDFKFRDRATDFHALSMVDRGRNTFRFPSTYVQDLRLSKTIKVKERYSVELLADAFNLANHTNVTGVTTLGYSVVSGTTPTSVPLVGGGTQLCSNAAPCLNFNTSGPTPAAGAPFAPQLGVPNSANSNFSYSPRQLQLGVRVKF